MITRKDNEDRQNSNLSDEQDKGQKYSDAGRDGDYSTELPPSIEEGDEDYDDETQENEEG